MSRIIPLSRLVREEQRSAVSPSIEFSFFWSFGIVFQSWIEVLVARCFCEDDAGQIADSCKTFFGGGMVKSLLREMDVNIIWLKIANIVLGACSRLKPTKCKRVLFEACDACVLRSSPLPMEATNLKL